MPLIRYVGGDEVKKSIIEGTIGSIVDGLILMHGGWDNIDGFMMSRAEDKYAITIFKDDQRYYYVYEEVKEEYVSKGV